MKRISAMAAVILLLAMYGATMFFALTDSPHSTGWFKASIYCTIAVPIVAYAIILVYRHLKNNKKHD